MISYIAGYKIRCDGCSYEAFGVAHNEEKALVATHMLEIEGKHFCIECLVKKEQEPNPNETH